jgi:hypothetical protein
MILLARDLLLFRLADGESVPLRPEMISFEVSGDAASTLDAETVNNAAAAVFHYFKHDLGRHSVSMGEFTMALEKVLCGFVLSAAAPSGGEPNARVLEADLWRLADESAGSELFFFSELRRELRARLRQSPAMLRFHGLRCCVKRLSGARRWSSRCQNLRDQIVEYLRGCLKADAREKPCSLVVD